MLYQLKLNGGWLYFSLWSHNVNFIYINHRLQLAASLKEQKKFFFFSKFIKLPYTAAKINTIFFSPFLIFSLPMPKLFLLPHICLYKQNLFKPDQQVWVNLHLFAPFAAKNLPISPDLRYTWKCTQGRRHMSAHSAEGHFEQHLTSRCTSEHTQGRNLTNANSVTKPLLFHGTSLLTHASTLEKGHLCAHCVAKPSHRNQPSMFTWESTQVINPFNVFFVPSNLHIPTV